MTEIVVMKIVELANAGELDPERSCIALLADLDYAPLPDAVGLIETNLRRERQLLSEFCIAATQFRH